MTEPNIRRVRFRRVTLRDLDVLVRQRRGMWLSMGEQNRANLDEEDLTYRRWVRTRLRSGTVVGWVGETDRREIVAGGIVWLRPSVPRPGVRGLAQPFLLSMYTEPRWRGLGLGSRIVGEALKWAKRNGHADFRLHASPMGRRLYLRQGFKRAWEMKLEL